MLEETSETLLSLLVIFITPNGCPEIIVIFIISKPLPSRTECFLRKPSLFLSLSPRGHEAITTLKDLRELQPRSEILRDFYRNLCLLDGWVGGWFDSWMDGWIVGWMDGWVDAMRKATDTPPMEERAHCVPCLHERKPPL